MNKRILFVTTVYRTGEKIYPVIPVFAKECLVDVLHIGQMSPETPWVGKKDPRDSFYALCDSVCDKTFYGPRWYNDNDKNGKNYKEFFDNIEKLLHRNYYDLVILDNNITIKGSNLSELYTWFHNQHVPVMACPHGNRDPKGYRITERFDRMFDYSFVFGKKEKKKLLSLDKDDRKYRKRLICGGIPSNDALITYERNNSYILVLPNMTDPQHIHGPVKGFHPFTKELFDHLQILKLADYYRCKVIIKEKNKMFCRSSLLSDSLKSYKNIQYIFDCNDDNKLVADAICVISAPSTMAFKPIQLGIPTAILKGHGMVGNFYDFPGLVDCDPEKVKNTLRTQDHMGICGDFVKNTLEGGLEFKSTDIYVQHICDFLKNEEN